MNHFNFMPVDMKDCIHLHFFLFLYIYSYYYTYICVCIHIFVFVYIYWSACTYICFHIRINMLWA